jgi:8-oxo-dGTP pyrophosphatase MutT (NUDIX family)
VKTRDVVTLFLYARGRILLLLRSAGVKTLAGRWAGLSGGVHEGESPRDAAMREMEEEVGIGRADVRVRGQGERLEVPDPPSGLIWRVDPFLATLPGMRPVRLDWEHAAYRWVAPEDLGRMRTVPGLPRTLGRLLGGIDPATLAPWRGEIDRILEDRSSGCSRLCAEGLDLMGRLAGAGDRTGARAIARLIGWGRPGMPGLARVLEEAWDAAPWDGGERDAALYFRRSSEESLDAPLAAGRRAAGAWRQGVRRSAAVRIATLSASRAVEAAVASFAQERSGHVAVRVLESRPPGEGVGQARRFAEMGISASVYPDGAIFPLLEGVAWVVMGSDGVFSDGSAVNKTGSRPLALAARSLGIPVWVVAQEAKRLRTRREDDLFQGEEGAPGEFLPEGAGGLAAVNPSFEIVPSDLISAIVTESAVRMHGTGAVEGRSI